MIYQRVIVQNVFVFAVTEQNKESEYHILFLRVEILIQVYSYKMVKKKKSDYRNTDCITRQAIWLTYYSAPWLPLKKKNLDLHRFSDFKSLNHKLNWCISYTSVGVKTQLKISLDVIHFISSCEKKNKKC